MKRKWYSIVTAVMAALLLTLTATPVLAQSEEEVTASPRPMLRVGLAIVAPRMAPAGEEVSMTVFDRPTQNPVKDAGIWALTQDEAETLKEKIEKLRGEGEASVQKLDWESLVSVHGIFLGETHGNGQLKYTFTEKGWYLLIAVKQGYVPDRTGIVVRTIPKALAIEAPRRAQVDEKVTVTVSQRGTEDPVKDAGIWALTRDEADTLKEEMVAIRAEGNTTAEELDYESKISVHGTFLGTTNGSGQLKHTFNEAGGYLLVAVKKGYFPGFAPIGIIAIPRISETPDSYESTR